MRKFDQYLLKGLPLLTSILGGFLLLFILPFLNEATMPILPGYFSESVNVAINFVNLGGELIPIEMENFLVFQSFESFPPIIYFWATLGFGILIWVLFVIGLVLLSDFEKMYFIGGCALVIFLMTFSGINGLNIGGISSNLGLLFLLVFTLIPLILIQYYFSHWTYTMRFLIIAIPSTLTLLTLIWWSSIPDPILLISENLTLPAIAIAVMFLFHIGNAIISGLTILLIKFNKGIGLKISWHIVILFTIYFLLLVFTLLDNMGEINLPFPTIPPVILMLVNGILGYYVLGFKIDQVKQPYSHPLIGKAIYVLGFAITIWVWSKAEFTQNLPLSEFFVHVLLYTQIALSLLFLAYLFTNFSALINKGTSLEQVLFKPQFFAYFHMRIGAIMTFVILTIYGQGIIGVQLNSAIINISADYYYQTDRPLEAAILYENSWIDYRKNDKAKNALAHLYFGLNQPTLAMQHLTESFDNAPNIPNILLLSSKLLQQEKVFEALFYLEKGLTYFPENPYLTNNLALLYSKLNRPIDALKSINQVSIEHSSIFANEVGLKAKHGLLDSEDIDPKGDIPLHINQLAILNLKGDLADFEINTHTLPEHHVLNASMLRNQWSNKTSGDLQSDLSLIDSLIAIEQTSIEELNYRITRILRTYQDQNINESLKYLNGLAYSFSNSAGYFHSLSANILAGQLDFEKAAIDLLVAEETGFENFKPSHLAILYFGGKQMEAINLHIKHDVDFPNWMIWNEEGKLLENEKTHFFTLISQLHKQMPDKFMAEILNITNQDLKAELAYYILIHKAHWLVDKEFEQLKQEMLLANNKIWTTETIDQLITLLKNPSNSIELEKDIIKSFQPHLSMVRNAYFTPFVFEALENEADELKKYEILQEASQFNKDPLLWIQYVKQSRKIGLDSYGSNALIEMQGWVSISDIEKLQLENL